MISALLLAVALGAAAAPGVVAPVPGPVVRGFAAPDNPFAAGHRGVDLAAAPGEHVRAALPGLVTFAGLVAGKGWVTIRHTQGVGRTLAGARLETTYGDLDPRLVVAGEQVEAGQVLGRLAATAGHLDWGARLDGRYIDPLGLLGRWEIHLVRDELPGSSLAAGRATGTVGVSSALGSVAYDTRRSLPGLGSRGLLVHVGSAGNHYTARAVGPAVRPVERRAGVQRSRPASGARPCEDQPP
jgi:murein DD-endopeptidase MepM/ murein hydrolase activator NlpD